MQLKAYLHDTICRTYDTHPGVCDRTNTRKNVIFQILPSAKEQISGISIRFHTPKSAQTRAVAR